MEIELVAAANFSSDIRMTIEEQVPFNSRRKMGLLEIETRIAEDSQETATAWTSQMITTMGNSWDWAAVWAVRYHGKSITLVKKPPLLFN